MADKVDWKKMQAEYIRDSKTSHRSLAEKYGISKTVVDVRANKEGWSAKRKEYHDKAFAKAMQKAATKDANQLAKLMTATNKAVDVVSRAFSDERQFNRYLVERREEYANGKLSEDGASGDDGDPVLLSQRQWTEEREFNKIDTKALRDLTVVLKDLTNLMRDFYNIPTADQAEARRIAAERLQLEQQKVAAMQEDGSKRAVEVVFGGEADTWAE